MKITTEWLKQKEIVMVKEIVQLNASVSVVMLLPMKMVIEYFAKYTSKNPYYFEGEAPNIIRIQLAIIHTMFETKNGKIKGSKLNRLQKLGLWLAQTHDPDEGENSKVFIGDKVLNLHSVEIC